MHRTGQVTKRKPDDREPQLVRSGRRYFVISPGSIPLNRKYLSKLGRSLHVTEETVYKDSSKRLYLAINMIIQSGTTEHSACVIQPDSRGVF